MTKTTLTLRSGLILSVENILRAYRCAKPHHMVEGLSWYADAHNLATTIASAHGTTVEAASGVIAALSPRCDWERNVTLAIRAFSEGFASGTLKAGCIKADLIMGGSKPLDVLSGEKVRNFYATIANPQNPLAVVIDRHAFDVAAGMVTDERSRKILGDAAIYDQIADLYIEASEILNVLPSQVQSVTWMYWRETHGKYARHLAKKREG